MEPMTFSCPFCQTNPQLAVIIAERNAIKDQISDARAEAMSIEDRIRNLKRRRDEIEERIMRELGIRTSQGDARQVG